MINVTSIPSLRHWPWEKTLEVAVLALVAGSVLWKGGKTLEITWILVGVSWLCTIVYWRNKKLEAESWKLEAVPMFLWLSVMLFIIWTAISYRYSTTQNYGLDEVLQTGALGLLFLWIARQNLQTTTYKLQTVLAYVTLVACVIGVLIYVLQPVNRLVGTFVDFRFHTDYWPNAWAQYLLLAWPIVLLWVKKNMRMERYLFLILGFVLGCLLLSYSRAAILAFGGQVVLFGILLQWQEEQSGMRFPWKMIRTHALVTALIAGGVFFLVNGIRGSVFEVQNIMDKAVFTADEGYSSVSERQQFWNQAMEFMWRSPMVGWGPYSFRFVQPHVQEGILATSDHPHNVLLKLGMERGIPGMVFFILIVGTVFIGVLRNIRYPNHIAVFVSISGVLAHNMVDYNLQFVGIALPFWLLLGVLAGKNTESANFTRLVRPVEVLLATILMIVALFEGRFLLVSSLGRHAESGGEDARAMLWYDEAKGAWFDRDLQLSRTHLLINKNRFEEGLIAIEDYLKRNNHDYRAWKLKGELLLGQGRGEEARSAYERALLFGKDNDLGILRGLTETLIALNQWDTLRDRLPKIEGEMQRFADAIEHNTHFIALSNNVEEYLRLSNRLADLYPKDAPRYQLMGARVDRAAAREREKVKGRPIGRLW
ncbi:O-antigen ligase family protein [Candidatus Peregrinibacteria bacterium]|nr:O-antigen ligase family protein [Candidatus Peregrinibacteria bacterium]